MPKRLLLTVTMTMMNPAPVHHDEKDENSPFVVLGVALIVDQIGHGAHMALRYPITPPVDSDKTNDDFFRLTPRQMAKLFRPKPPLCGQAMTLSIGGTLFCCCATLLSNETNVKANAYAVASTNPENSSDDNHISLFSIVIALGPRVRTSTIPITGWVQEKNDIRKEDDSGEEPSQAQTQQTRYHGSLSNLQGKLCMPKSHESDVSPSFKCIQRVHTSLSQLSRILLREERRCQYVSLQCQLYRKIRANVAKSRHQLPNKKLNAQASSVSNSPASMVTKSVTQAQQAVSEGSNIQRSSHHRNSSWTLEREVNVRPVQETERHNSTITGSKTDLIVEEQEALEAILALSFVVPECPSMDLSTLTDGDESANSLSSAADNEPSQLSELGHCGNLAQEIIAFYHALARTNDQSPFDLLGVDGVIYVNRHIAVAVDPISAKISYDSNTSKLKPHHTLLFPQASPTELLASLKSTAPRLHQLLTLANPQKSLKEIAVEANLPLQTAMELAMYLIHQGICLASPVLTRSSILCCQSIDDIHEHSLKFVQEFGPCVNLFLLVSFLTSGKTLGECMGVVTTSVGGEALYLRRQLEDMLPSASYETRRRYQHIVDINRVPDSDDTERIEELEETLYSMAVWLRSRGIMFPILEFLVAVDTCPPDLLANNSGQGEKKSEDKVESDGTADDTLFQELLEFGCLTGTTSIEGCCWRVQMDYQRLRAFADRHELIRIVSRAPLAADDW
jgi:hypothetical protein